MIIMSCGGEYPYEGAYHALAKRLDRVSPLMKPPNLDIRRLRLTTICTVCNRAAAETTLVFGPAVEHLCMH